MNNLLEWLDSYGAEYDVARQILTIRKPMNVGDFVELKKVLKEKSKVKDIIVEDSKYERRRIKEV